MVSESTFKKVKDNYEKNPMHIISSNEQRDIHVKYNNKNKSKIDRISNIFSSTQIKNSVQTNKNLRTNAPDKILNQNTEYLNEATKRYNNPRKKRFNHVMDNGRGYYF